ncbi:hypothetical protein D3C77_528620 [compost metagenome]
MLSLPASSALISGCALSIEAATALPLAISQSPDCTETTFICAASIASLKPAVRCWALVVVETPSMMPTWSPALSFSLARYSPTRRAPLRLSGPTKGTLRCLLLSTSGSRRLSMLITVMPASMAFFTTGTRALESAGAMTSALTPDTIICSTIRIWLLESVSSLMPLEISSKSAAWAFW